MNIKAPTLPAAASFDWTLVRSFLAVLEQGTLLGAARVLQSSQPTIGRHIAEFEAQLGASLFERTGRGLLPTEMALRLADSARQMELAALAMARAASGGQSQIAGRVRVSASQPVACVLLPQILAQMRLALPDITVELVVSNSVTDLLRREADIAVRMVQPEQASLIVRRVGQVGIGAYAHKDYLRRRGIPKQPADLIGHDLVSDDRRGELEQGFRAGGLMADPARLALRTDDMIAYAAAVRAGLGIGFIAHYVARAQPDLVPVLPALKLPVFPTWLVVHREIRTSGRVKAVYDFLAPAISRELS